MRVPSNGPVITLIPANHGMRHFMNHSTDDTAWFVSSSDERTHCIFHSAITALNYRILFVGIGTNIFTEKAHGLFPVRVDGKEMLPEEDGVHVEIPGQGEPLQIWSPAGIERVEEESGVVRLYFVFANWNEPPGWFRVTTFNAVGESDLSDEAAFL